MAEAISIAYRDLANFTTKERVAFRRKVPDRNLTFYDLFPAIHLLPQDSPKSSKKKE